MNAYQYQYWVVIRVYETEFPTSKQLHFIKWERLPFSVRTKWDWYFRYRAALFQVQYPKSLIQFSAGQHEKSQQQVESEMILFKVRGKLASITKTKNKIQQSESTWNQLFPITDYEPYQKATAKLSRLQAELEDLIRNNPEICHEYL